ncbi:hypothetical protein BC938DRAFT_473629 [Jimgerdemannia flammicorona]|uniref:Uncharacterized protein n=1 Tax=Jimgerdemannia flammicorona TaxID=994334 RepID=A0A433QT96_9FUNG|nr:hypothetical protein BC938DRAFT_473629 [Jimgerdemannia flammicorona]
MEGRFAWSGLQQPTGREIFTKPVLSYQPCMSTERERRQLPAKFGGFSVLDVAINTWRPERISDD